MNNNNFGSTDPNTGSLAGSSAKEKMKAFGKIGTDHMKTKVLTIDQDDKKIWELITNVPHVSKPVAVAQAILNLIFPGFGTIVMAFASKETTSKTQLSIGFFQLLSSFILIGWIWAIYWSYLCCRKAWDENYMMNYSN